MSQLFPTEIIKSSCENYFTENSATSRIIYLSVMLFLLVIISLLPLIKVQVTTQSDGIVRAKREDNPIIPVVTGEVISCRISENQVVRENDTLLIMATDQINQELYFLNYRKTEVNQLCFDLQKLLSGDSRNLKTALGNQENQSFSAKLKEGEIHLKQAEQEYILAKTLYNKGITPKHDFENISGQYQYEKNRLFSIKAEQLTLWQEKLKEANLEFTEINSKIVQLQKTKNQYLILAPISGTITGYSGVLAGNFVVPNQQIAKISPNNDLLVECYVPPKDIGMIYMGMSATFQFHAYNYNLWGVASGSVKEISKNVTNINNYTVFRVRCQLDQTYLMLRNGTQGELIKGMTVTSRFKIAERTLFQLLYDKADNWLNPKLKKG